jgi:hypothetical protein
MKAPLILTVYALKRVRTLVAGMAALLAAFQVLLIVVARSIESSNSFEQLGDLMPPFVRQLLGPSFLSLMSFSGIVCLGYFHLAVMGSLIGLAIAWVLCRHRRLRRVCGSDAVAPYCASTDNHPSIIMMMICTLAVLAVMMLGTWVG